MKPRREPSLHDVTSATGRRHAFRAAGAAGVGLLATLGLTRTSEAKKGKKSKKGPAGPPGPQGPAGAQGPAGPKAFVSAPVERTATCSVPVSNVQTCAVACNTGEIAISGGWEAVRTDVFAYGCGRVGTTGWGIAVRNTSTTDASDFTVKVYCVS